ncbi:hypothetical protein [Streptomyces lydicus]|uniref:hypothetical protein n=1 Tax=Streptomyces lydicus TaxID=47763 RepID=UPI00382EB30B
MAIDTTFDLQPETDPTATETDTPNDDQTTPSTPTTPATDRPAAQPISHTPGGLPAIPLAITTANTTIAGLSAAALTGGPGLAVAAGVMVAAVAGGVAARGSNRKTKAHKTPTRQPAGTNRSGSGSRSSSGTPSTGSLGASGSRRGGAGSAHSRGTAVGPRRSSLGSTGVSNRATRPTGSGQSANGRLNLKNAPAGARGATLPRQTSTTSKTPTGSTAAGRAGARPKGGKVLGGSSQSGQRTGTGASHGGKSPSTPRKTGGALGSIKALRTAKKNNAPTRAALRKQTAADRARHADTKTADRNAKHQARMGRLAKKGKAARTAAKALDRAHRARNTAKQAARDSRNARLESRIDKARGMRRRAAATMKMRRRLLNSSLRYWGRRLLNAGLATPLGLLGCLTTPLGRRLGWLWLIQPGRRLRAHLDHLALRARVTRDKRTRKQHKKDLKHADNALSNTVPRAPRHHNAYDHFTGATVSEALKFLFDESASEMEAAAQAYEPGGMMHVLQTVEGMPAALQSIANTFAIVAEKSDEAWALEKEVGESLNDVFQILNKAVEAAEQVKEVFEAVHEHDINRIREPRVSAEAEKGWDVINNEDYA